MKKKKEQLLSIVIPAYNEERTIGKVLEIINKQTYKNKEVIVIDDCSKDSTNKIARKYGARVHRNKKNKGLGYGINKGFELSKGEIFIILEADVIPKGSRWLENLVQPLLDNKQIKMVTSLIEPGGGSKSLIDRLFALGYNPNYGKMSGEVSELKINFSLKADAFRRDAFKKSGGCSSKAFLGEDRDLYHKFLECGYRCCLQPKSRAVHMLSSRQIGLKRNLKRIVQCAIAEPYLHRRYQKERNDGGALVPLLLFSTLLFSLIPVLTILPIIAGFLLSQRVRIAFSGYFVVLIVFLFLNITYVNVFFAAMTTYLIILSIGWGARYAIKLKNSTVFLIGIPIFFSREICRIYGYLVGLKRLV